MLMADAVLSGTYYIFNMDSWDVHHYFALTQREKHLFDLHKDAVSINATYNADARKEANER